MKARDRELAALLAVAVMLTAGFAAVFVVRSDEIGDLSLIYGAYFLALCLGAHLFLRLRLPYADPYLLPLCALLAAIGLVAIFRIDEGLARDQANWFVLGLVLFVATILFLRDYQGLQRYRYLIATAGILLLLAPLLPGIGGQVRGAFLAVDLGFVSFQTNELAKICIIIFLASYLAEKREMLSVAARRFAGVTIPPLKHFGPLLVVWGAAMAMLVLLRDLGPALMFFGAFLALLYVATSRLSYVLSGLGLFVAGAWALAGRFSHVRERFDIWLDPFDPAGPEGAGQIQQSLFAQADGGLFGQGLGESLIRLPGPFFPPGCESFPDCGSILPAPHTDAIFAVIAAELGLFGASAVILIYALIAARGFKTAVMAPDGFSKLFATGLTAVLTFQAFVIIGGVVHLIPLTGVTQPFVSYGGSSVVANMVLLALLLMVSDRARRPPSEGGIAPDPSGSGVAGGSMNQQIVRIFAFALFLLALLVAWTSRWTVFEADELEARAENRRALIAEQQIRRGSISTADGVLVAESRPRGGGEDAQPVFVRRYPEGALFGNPVGYSYVNIGRSGIEQSLNGLLVGEENEFTSIIDQLRGRTREGADVTLTLDAGAQRLAVNALQSAVASAPGSNGAGSVVAIEPDTGAVRVMASIPSFDPNEVRNEETFSALAEEGFAGPLVNRPTQSTYEPGSTMKVVTAAAALDAGDIDPGTVLTASSPMQISGVPLQNFGGQSFGSVDATTALTQSVNTYWAQVGERLGTDTYIEYLDRFGFNADPELDYPGDQMAPSGVYEEGSLLGAGDAIDIGRVSIGQERLLTSPLQMAQVAGAIANDGVLIEPTFLQEARDPDGRTVEELDPERQDRVISEEAAAQVTEMMTNVTREGTASGLSVDGVEFAGKTGTAEIDVAAGINRPWFVGFAPAQDPEIAVAVMLERCNGCFGGTVAGPAAARVMGALLR